jgi:hypothetical protein
MAAEGGQITGIVATAYNPAVAAADAVRSSGSGVKVDSGSFVVTKANVADYDEARQQKTRQLKTAFADKYLSCG